MRRSTATLLATLVAALTLLPGALALAQSPTPTYIKEDYAAFQSQLNGGKIRSVTFNKKAHSLRITLDNGTLYVASYPPLQYKAISAQITAKGVPVSILHVTKSGTTTTTHHKLRYIAAGILVVVVIVIALVLGFNRRRPPADAPSGDGTVAGSGPAPSPGE